MISNILKSKLADFANRNLAAVCKTGNIEDIAYLLELGASVGSALYAFEDAIVSGNNTVVEFLIDNGFDPNTASYNKFGYSANDGSALEVAVYHNNPHAVSLLIKHGADVNKVCGEYGRVALDRAWSEDSKGNDKLECAKLLIDAGADLNMPRKLGPPTLIGAIKLGKLKNVQFLIDCGADVTMTNHINGNTALDEVQHMISCFREDYKQFSAIRDSIVKKIYDHNLKLQQSGENVTLAKYYNEPRHLTEAVMDGDLDTIRLYIKQGDAVNVYHNYKFIGQYGFDGNTTEPLIQYVFYSKNSWEKKPNVAEVVKILVQHGALYYKSGNNIEILSSHFDKNIITRSEVQEWHKEGLKYLRFNARPQPKSAVAAVQP